MKIELKNFKHAEFASHETHCYEATVWVDGKRAFYASNEGHGGADDYTPLHAEGKDPKEAWSEFNKVQAEVQAHITSECKKCGGTGKTDERNRFNSKNQWIQFAKKMGDLGDSGFVSHHSHMTEDCQREFDMVQESIDNFVDVQVPHKRPTDDDEMCDCIDCMLEVFMGNLINTKLLAKDLKKLLKSRVLMLDENDDGELKIFEVKYKGVRAIKKTHVVATASRYPSAIILNCLAFDEALEIYSGEQA